jgi:hypothetical protein
VHAENLLIDEGSNGETIETISERLPELDRVAAFA